MKDFDVTVEGPPQNIFSYRFKHHIDHYRNLFDKYIEKDNIIAIGIYEKEGIYIQPKKANSFNLQYNFRCSLERPKKHSLHRKSKRLDIFTLVQANYRCCKVRIKLQLLTDETIWINIVNDLKKSIVEA